MYNGKCRCSSHSSGNFQAREGMQEKIQPFFAREASPVVPQKANTLFFKPAVTSTEGKMINKQEERFCPNAEVEDSVVQSHINSALASAKNNLQTAFAILRNKRESNCCDVNLAAAEHYMYARLQVAQGDLSFFWITMIIMYDFAKFLHLVPRTGDCPITRASWAQIRWASQGAIDGDMDYYNNPH